MPDKSPHAVVIRFTQPSALAMHFTRQLTSLLPVAVLAAAGLNVAAQPPSAGSTPTAGPACEVGMRSLTENAADIIRRTNANNSFAMDHAEKYKLEVAACELAKKAKDRALLEACVSLLDRAQARADKGNEAARVLATDTESLRASASRHNQRCPLHQVQVLQQ